MKIQIAGDSLAARYEGHEIPILNDLLAASCPGIEVLNTAISGQNSQDLLGRIEVIQKAGGDCLFLFVGSNDLARHKQIVVQSFRANLSRLIDGLQGSVGEIILVSPPPVDEQKQVFRDNQLISTYVHVMKVLAGKKNCLFLNLFQLFSESDIPLVELMTGLENDGLHFGEAGYQLLVEKMLALINGCKATENVV